MVNSSGAEAKAAQFVARLRAQITGSLSLIKSELQSAAAVQAPTPEQEYATLMVGDGGGSPGLPLEGGRSADTDGRVRFEKTEGTFIHDVILNVENGITGPGAEGILTAAIGNIQDHIEASYFNFTNADGQTHRVGPYFTAFEFGSAQAGWNTEIVPHSPGSRPSGYPLTPDEDPSHNTMSMSKPIEARNMYSRFTLDPVAQSVISQILREAIRD